VATKGAVQGKKEASLLRGPKEGKLKKTGGARGEERLKIPEEWKYYLRRAQGTTQLS